MSSMESTRAQATRVNAEGREELLLEWTVHLLRERPGRVLGLAGAVVVAGGYGILVYGSPLFGLLAGALVGASAAEYLFPIRFRVTTRRASSACLAARMEISWERVRRVDYGTGAIRLSPFRRACRLDQFRGVLLRFSPEQQPEVAAAIARCLEDARRA